MDNECLYCKNYNSCEVIKSLIRWRQERRLIIENTGATWVIDSMGCDLFVKDESLPEFLMRQEDGRRYEAE